MLVFLDRKLAFLAVPKTGTTAWEAALNGQADITLRRRLKHMTAQKFQRRMLPFLRDTYGVEPERLAVMRDPLDHMKSWFRYRRKAALRRPGNENDTGDLDFGQFCLDVISDDPPPHARIGSQHNFLTSGKGALLVDHLFAYDRQAELLDFLEHRFDMAIKVPRKNSSPDVDTRLSPEIEAHVRRARAADFDLFERLTAAGGYLHTPQG